MANYDFLAIQNHSENKGANWVLQDKQGVPEFVFSDKAFQRLAELLGHARSSDARQFHMNNCLLLHSRIDSEHSRHPL